jgi:hypothetical protein
MEENRIEAGIREWKGHARKLTDLFGESILGHRNMERAKLAHYRETYLRPLNGVTNEEKVLRPILKGEIKRMERALYPSALVRMVRSIGRLITQPKPKIPKPDAPAQLMIKEPTHKEARPQVVTKREVSPCSGAG